MSATSEKQLACQKRKWMMSITRQFRCDVLNKSRLVDFFSTTAEPSAFSRMINAAALEASVAVCSIESNRESSKLFGDSDKTVGYLEEPVHVRPAY